MKVIEGQHQAPAMVCDVCKLETPILVLVQDANLARYNPHNRTTTITESMGKRCPKCVYASLSEVGK